MIFHLCVVEEKVNNKKSILSIKYRYFVVLGNNSVFYDYSICNYKHLFRFSPDITSFRGRPRGKRQAIRGRGSGDVQSAPISQRGTDIPGRRSNRAGRRTLRHRGASRAAGGGCATRFRGADAAATVVRKMSMIT